MGGGGHNEPRVKELTADLSREDLVPYFLWDEDLSVADLRRRLREAPEEERLRLAGKILREAAYDEVWTFLGVEEVARDLPRMARHLGRQRAFWECLVGEWRRLGLLR